MLLETFIEHVKLVTYASHKYGLNVSERISSYLEEE